MAASWRGSGQCPGGALLGVARLHPDSNPRGHADGKADEHGARHGQAARRRSHRRVPVVGSARSARGSACARRKAKRDERHPSQRSPVLRPQSGSTGRCRVLHRSRSLARGINSRARLRYGPRASTHRATLWLRPRRRPVRTDDRRMPRQVATGAHSGQESRCCRRRHLRFQPRAYLRFDHRSLPRAAKSRDRFPASRTFSLPTHPFVVRRYVRLERLQAEVDAEKLRRDWVTNQETFCWQVAVEGGRVTCHDRRSHIAPDHLILYPELIWRRYRHGALVDEAVLRIPMRCYYPDEFSRLIANHGFRITDRWGGYAGEAYGVGPELVVRFQRTT